MNTVSGRVAVIFGSFCAQRSGRRVARVHERLLAGGGLLGVDLLEAGQRQVDLAAHLDLAGLGDAQRDRTDRPQVGRHVLAGGAVAPGGAAHEHAVAVEQRDRQPVDLRLGDQLERLVADPPLHTFRPLPELLLVAGVGQREHGLQVLHRREPARGRGAHAVGGRVRRDQRRIVSLELLQLAHQLVVLGIRHARVVEHVVAVVGVVQPLPQLGRPLRAAHVATTSSGVSNVWFGHSSSRSSLAWSPHSAAPEATPAARAARMS